MIACWFGFFVCLDLFDFAVYLEGVCCCNGVVSFPIAIYCLVFDMNVVYIWLVYDGIGLITLLFVFVLWMRCFSLFVCLVCFVWCFSV